MMRRKGWSKWILLVAALFAPSLLIVGVFPYLKDPNSLMPGLKDRSINIPTCRGKEKNIAFLKVHKCGSTSMSNILQRFGLRNNLNFVLPDKNTTENRYWVLGNLRKLKSSKIIGLPRGERYHILSVDTGFDAEMYRKYIPGAFILGIMREPVDRFVSRDFYDSRAKRLIQKYGNDPYIYAHLTNRSVNEQSVRSGMHHDYGLPISGLLNDDVIHQTLHHIDTEFDFVAIMEYFDESLVLLKRKLCWETQDIVYITRNVGRQLQKSTFALSPTHYQTIKQIQKADVIFYNYFRHKLQKQIIDQGRDLLDEVFHFKIVLRLVRDFCSNEQGPVEIVIPPDQWTKIFKVTRTDCKLMMFSEFPMVALLQKTQREKLTRRI